MEAESHQATKLLILQPTSLCNLSCSYCYVPGRSDRGSMPAAVLEAVRRRLIESALVADHVQILWHAGEPLAAGIGFYRRAHEILEGDGRCGPRIQYSLQTNGTLVDTRWAELLAVKRYQVGVSVDGPRELHDRARSRKDGSGSWQATIRGAALLRDAGCDIGVICVLGDHNIDDPDAVYDFFVKHDLRWVAFNVDELEGTNRRSSLGSASAEADQRYVTFMRRFWDRWMADGRRLHVREFARTLEAVRSVLNGVAPVTPSDAVPLSIITVTKDGSVSTFAPELAGHVSERHGNFAIGHVLSDTRADWLESRVLATLSSEVAQGNLACRTSCAYFPYCGGGHTANRFFETGSFERTETMACRLHRKRLTDVVLAGTRAVLKAREPAKEEA